MIKTVIEIYLRHEYLRNSNSLIHIFSLRYSTMRHPESSTPSFFQHRKKPGVFYVAIHMIRSSLLLLYAP